MDMIERILLWSTGTILRAIQQVQPPFFLSTQRKKPAATTMKLSLLATFIASATAFTTSSSSSNSARSSTLQAKAADFDADFGAMLPLGFWDPLGLVADGDQAKFDRLRLTELKHGRIAMIAVVGNLVTEAGIRWPGDVDQSGLAFADIPGGYAAIEAIPYAGNLQMFAFIGALEVLVMRDFVGGEFPGDLRNNYIDFGWDTLDEAAKSRKRTIELNNGRAAMMGILGLMVHEQLGVSILPSLASTEYTF